ncbi:glycoside hydrolase domain-containing protein [Streptomyces triticirhizae]|nr:glycoside hydrolase domain-containing protein [Streptomyces triticirhizae]
MGVSNAFPGGGVEPKVFKALLTMDPYVLVGDGTGDVRGIQQWMNERYVRRREFFIIPCGGQYSREVARALMLAIQYEIGMSDDQANGVFGPGTQQGLREHPLSVGSEGNWVLLFSAAMIFKQRSGVFFSSVFGSGLEAAVEAFQRFTRLSVNGRADFPTWASLLVSTGDPTRKGTACDCVTEITPDRARALRDEGYLYVGRYLTNVPGTTLDRNIKPGELETIADAGLSVYPIYQTYGGAASYFSEEQGVADALAAIDAYNHSVRAGIITGTPMDPASDADLWATWQQLNQDNVYCVSTVPHVHFHHAELIGAPRPSLDISEQGVLDLPTRYQGELDHPDAQEGGRRRLGLCRILEQYNAFMRNL